MIALLRIFCPKGLLKCATMGCFGQECALTFGASRPNCSCFVARACWRRHVLGLIQRPVQSSSRPVPRVARRCSGSASLASRHAHHHQAHIHYEPGEQRSMSRMLLGACGPRSVPRSFGRAIGHPGRRKHPLPVIHGTDTVRLRRMMASRQPAVPPDSAPSVEIGPPANPKCPSIGFVQSGLCGSVRAFTLRRRDDQRGVIERGQCQRHMKP